jgi:hypothetical protein
MKTPRTAKQTERQSTDHRTAGRYAKVNPCYVCGKSAGVDYYSDRADTTGENGEDFGDLGLCLCEKCANKSAAMSDADAYKFLANGVAWK